MQHFVVTLGVGCVVLGPLSGCHLFKKEKPAEAVAALQVDAGEEVIPDIPEPDGGLAEPVAEGESTASADALLEQMKASGLKVTKEFRRTGRKYGAKNCIEGALDGVPTILCEYADAEAAKAQKSALEEWATDMPTGVVDRNGKTLLSAKASKEIDSTNEKVNRIITAFNRAR